MHSFFQPKMPPPAAIVSTNHFAQPQSPAASSFERYTGYLSDMSDDGDFDSNSDDESGNQGNDAKPETSMSQTVHPP
jgi:hypothetical protein